MSNEDVLAAGEVLKRFVFSRQTQFRNARKEMSATAGYGDYSGRKQLAASLACVWEYMMENFGSVAIPGAYASPVQLRQAVVASAAYVEHEALKFGDLIKSLPVSPDVGIPENASRALEAMTDCRDAVCHAKSILKVDGLQAFFPSLAENSCTDILRSISGRFPSVVQRLKQRRANRHAVTISDEYDVQYLFTGLMALSFDDIRPEEATPSVAGSSSRADAFLSDHKTFVEFKMMRGSLDSKKVAVELAADFVWYAKHPECRSLFIFIYDPEGRIHNPRGFEKDMSEPRPPIDIVNTIICGPR